MSENWSRRAFLQSGLAGATIAAFPAAALCKGSDDIEIGAGRRLFLDDRLIDSDLTRGVTRVLNPPVRIARVLKPERAAEALGFIFYCSVVDDGGTARLFHGSYNADKQKHFALATSDDGVHWERPRLGRKGSRDDNRFRPHAPGLASLLRRGGDELPSTVVAVSSCNDEMPTVEQAAFAVRAMKNGNGPQPSVLNPQAAKQANDAGKEGVSPRSTSAAVGPNGKR
jgi:hypothetical protein